MKIKRKLKELLCLFFRHKWVSDFEPKGNISNSTKERTYCKRCGVYYHEHEYHE